VAKRPRYDLHFTPTGASWINLVERWFAALTKKQVRRSACWNTRKLEQAIEKYLEINKDLW
jgi:transposase